MPAPLSMEAFKLLADSLSNIDRLISDDVNFKNKLAYKVLEVSRDFIPYDTGKLNDSAKVKDGMIIQDVPYAGYVYNAEEFKGYIKSGSVERGTTSVNHNFFTKSGPHKLFTEQRQYERQGRMRGSGVVFNKSVHKNATSHWFERGIETHRDEINSYIKELVNNAIIEAIKKA